MMKKMMMAATMTAVVTAAMFTMSAMAAENEKIEAGRLVVEIPDKYKDLLTVQTEGLDADTLISVSETASIEAAKATGGNNDGAGWLFSISCIPEYEMKKLRCGDMSGIEVFAEDEDFYYAFNHPTDVRMIRETNEEMTADMDQWSELNEWASTEVRETTLANNPWLDKEFFSNTTLDMYLARAAYEGMKFEIRSLDFGTLDPTIYHEDDFLENLLDDVYFERVELSDEEAPDGEYIVLAFDEDNVRFDFFPGEEAQNYIREVRVMDDGEEMVTFYKANFKDPNKTAYMIMKKWADAMMRADQNTFDDLDDFDVFDDFDNDDRFDDDFDDRYDDDRYDDDRDFDDHDLDDFFEKDRDFDD